MTLSFKDLHSNWKDAFTPYVLISQVAAVRPTLQAPLQLHMSRQQKSSQCNVTSCDSHYFQAMSVKTLCTAVSAYPTSSCSCYRYYIKKIKCYKN